MIEKKKSGLSLEKNRTAFFSAGLILVSALVLTAFEWKTLSIQEQFSSRMDDEDAHIIEEEIIMDLPQPPKPKAPQPPKKHQTKVANVVIIDNQIDDPDPNIDLPDITDPIDIEIPGGGEGPIVDPIGKLYTGAVEQMPEFPGGFAAMQKFILDNVDYPALAREFGEQGIAFIEFTVETDGSISRLESKRAFDYGLDIEALRVVKLMPKWKAGEQRGRKVRVRFTIPIKFSLAPN